MTIALDCMASWSGGGAISVGPVASVTAHSLVTLCSVTVLPGRVCSLPYRMLISNRSPGSSTTRPCPGRSRWP
jgi:hypothetical protein